MRSKELNLALIQPFKLRVYPFVYAVDDRIAMTDVLKMFSGKKYGLETGFGVEPSRLFHIDNTIPWIVTEPDARCFDGFKRNINVYWKDVDFTSFRVPNPIIALRAYSSHGLEQTAQHVVYRNLDYGTMSMVPQDDLREGQSVTFIVNGMHVKELQYYRWYLENYGYDPDLLQLRPQSRPPLSFPYAYAPDEYVLDFTKEPDHSG